ncbi:hypothetical protein D9V29_00880 [Mycetocola manganoxydans]|uniref:Uncharacterized protein n=1 Tax=Mycetocola manganoxydans TaxID=699879 RepID=A0A3L7A1D4_9MICO|nr:DUF6541 family protein [Mycetocola manganoxydans]RLP73884.1 hypothetical protein D9V29_00880 [Mycetocola manganoxydans]GHD42527.1 hypothetical protein GCM10008097_08580 [Mycetocola manganoxydans]
MSWLSALPVLAVSIGFFYLPGLAVLLAAGARGFVLHAAAPAVSAALVAVLAIAFPFVALPWAVPVVMAALLAIAAGTAVVHRLLTGAWGASRRYRKPTERSWIITALAIAAVAITIQLVIVIGDPTNMSQTFDAAFHLNGVKFVLDSANASSFHLSGLILPPGASSFYPAAWHGMVSLVAASSGGDVLMAANTVNIVIAAGIWPAGVVALSRALAPGSRVAILAAGVLSAGIPGFPILPLDYGVLYPYFFALAFIPLALALGLSVLGLVPRGTLAPPVLAALTLAVTLVAMGLAQSAVVFAWAAMLVPAALAVVVRIWRGSGPRGVRWAAVLAFGIAMLVFAAAWYVIGRLGNTSPWDAHASPVYALYELISNSREGAFPAVVISVLTIVGLVSVLRNGRWWIGGMWAVSAVLFLLAASLPYGDLRNVTIGLFYKDTPRLTALLATIAVPIAVLGVSAVWRFAEKRLQPRLDQRLRAARIAPVLPFFAAVLLLAATQGNAMQYAVADARPKYAMTESSPILSIDERTILERLGEHVPEDSIVAGNPWTGASLAYVVGDRRVLNPHFNISSDPEHVTVNTRLNEAGTDPEVCAALESLGVGYVLDFGIYTRDAGGVLSFDSTTNFEGYLNLAESGAVTEIDRENDKVLYRITGCD